MNFKTITFLITLGIIKLASGQVGGTVRPSQLGNEMINDTLIAYLSTGRCTLDVRIRGFPEYTPPTEFFFNDLNMEPLPNEDDTVAYFEGVSPITGASIKIKNPNYMPGVTCQFPDVAPTDAGGEHNIMIDMKAPYDSTSVDPYLGNIFFSVKRLDNLSDSIAQPNDPFYPGYSMHISNLDFINPPKHRDSLIVRVRREYASLAWEKTDTVTMDTTEYWAAYVVPRMTFNPEDSVTSGITEGERPSNISLSAYPNPFNSAVSISAPEGAEVEVFDLNGRRVAQLPDGGTVGVGLKPARAGGSETLPYGSVYLWTPDKSLGSGVYLVRARVGDKEAMKRVVYLK